jgi:hypothetical protein
MVNFAFGDIAMAWIRVYEIRWEDVDGVDCRQLLLDDFPYDTLACFICSDSMELILTWIVCLHDERFGLNRNVTVLALDAEFVPELSPIAWICIVLNDPNSIFLNGFDPVVSYYIAVFTSV